MKVFLWEEYKYFSKEKIGEKKPVESFRGNFWGGFRWKKSAKKLNVENNGSKSVLLRFFSGLDPLEAFWKKFFFGEFNYWEEEELKNLEKTLFLL